MPSTRRCSSSTSPSVAGIVPGCWPSPTPSPARCHPEPEPRSCGGSSPRPGRCHLARPEPPTTPPWTSTAGGRLAGRWWSSSPTSSTSTRAGRSSDSACDYGGGICPWWSRCAIPRSTTPPARCREQAMTPTRGRLRGASSRTARTRCACFAVPASKPSTRMRGRCRRGWSTAISTSSDGRACRATPLHRGAGEIPPGRRIQQQRVEHDQLQGEVDHQEEGARTGVHATEIGQRDDDAEDVEHDDDPASDIRRPSDHDTEDDVDDPVDQRDDGDHDEDVRGRVDERISELGLVRVVAGDVRDRGVARDQDVHADRADAETDQDGQDGFDDDDDLRECEEEGPLVYLDPHRCRRSEE